MNPQPLDNKSTLILLDTNFLLCIGQMRLNISHELDRVVPQHRTLIVLEPIFAELQEISQQGNPKVRLESRTAFQFVHKNCEIRPSRHSHKNIDFILLSTAQDIRGIIATNDRQLRNLARKKNIKVLYVRNKRWLELK